MIDKLEIDRLLQKAKSAYDRAYAPYSNFHVGASILLKNGETIEGVNVENVSFGLTNCAERSALFTAYSMGYCKSDILALVVVGNTNVPISPCGACRQVMAELMDKDTPVVMSNLAGDMKVATVSELLPYSFDGLK